MTAPRRFDRAGLTPRAARTTRGVGADRFSQVGVLVLLAWLMAWPAGSAAGQNQSTYRQYFPFVMRAFNAAPWLQTLNGYRAQAGLPALTEVSAWSQGCQEHARYMVKNDVIDHSDDPADPWFTQAGSEAAQSSNLMASLTAGTTDAQAFAQWMKAPFHAVGLLDPRLLQVGFGSFREADPTSGGLEMGAAVDILHGLSAQPSGVAYPIAWLGPGSSVALARATNETPDPLSACPEYSAPVGLPIIVQFGAGSGAPVVTGSRLSRGGAELDHCVFTENSYTNPNAADQQRGRWILGERDAVVLIPRQPLQVGQTYSVEVNTNLGVQAWSFSVVADE